MAWLNDPNMIKLNAWANAIVNILTHVLIASLAFTLLEGKILRLITLLYCLFVALGIITPEKQE